MVNYLVADSSSTELKNFSYSSCNLKKKLLIALIKYILNKVIALN